MAVDRQDLRGGCWRVLPVIVQAAEGGDRLGGASGGMCGAGGGDGGARGGLGCAAGVGAICALRSVVAVMYQCDTQCRCKIVGGLVIKPG